MGLLKKDGKKKPLKSLSRGGPGGGVSAARPQQAEKLPPCTKACPSGNDIRGWLTLIAQREKTGLSLEQAYEQAWQLEVETNPFPSVMGRVCPNPCEGQCNRKEKDGAVAINSIERFFGDFALQHKLALSKLEGATSTGKKVAVVGAGPSGMSCAYQLVRRGHQVTVFEELPKAGGMLRYGIPEYRLPRDVLDAEVQRIVDLGVELRCGTTIGKDVTLDQLRKDFDAVFVGIGAHMGKKVGIPGEEGGGVYTGTEFLRAANSNEPVEVGQRVIVIGGGDTAVDAARMSLRVGHDAAGVLRRKGSDVTILYRRTRKEMPAIDREIEEALEEGINLVFLAAPAKILRDDAGNVRGMLVQKMELGEPDSSGRRRPVPIEGAVEEIEAETVIAAVSQQPDWKALGALGEKGNWLEVDAHGKTGVESVWSGGDNVTLGLATISIGQGRLAALSIDAALMGKEEPPEDKRQPVGPDRLKLDYYEAKPRAERKMSSAEERLANPMAEADHGITKEQALEEVTRCFSCGLCFGCERCWMYCTPSCFSKLSESKPGVYYNVKLDTCDGCKKCADECPCGFLDMI